MPVYSESLAQYHFSLSQSFHLKAGKFYFIQWKSSILVTGSCTSCLISFVQWVTEFNYFLNKLQSHLYHHSCSYQTVGLDTEVRFRWHVPQVTSFLLTPLLRSSKNTLLPWWSGDLPLKVPLENYSLMKSLTLKQNTENIISAVRCSFFFSLCSIYKSKYQSYIKSEGSLY